MSKLNKRVAFIVCYILGVIFFATISHKLGINADSASAILIAKDGASGNFLLRGWHLSTQPYYFTDIFFLTLIFKIFGFHLILANVFAGILYATLILLSFKLAGPKSYIGIGVIIGVIALPSHYQSISSLVVNIHVGTYVFSLLCMILAINFVKDGKVRHLYIMMLISIFVLYSDSIFLYTLLLPVAAAALISRILGFTDNRRLFYLLLSCMITVIGSIALGLVMSTVYHYQLPPSILISNPRFQTQELMGENIYLFFNGMLDYFTGKFYGLEIKSIRGTAYLFNFLVTVLFMYLVIYSCIKSLKIGFAEILLSLAAIAMVLAFLISGLTTDVMSPRYFFFSLVTGSIVIGRVVQVRNEVRNTLIIVFLMAGISKAYPLIHDIKDHQLEQVNSALISHGLKYGYSDFFDGSAITILGDADIAPLFFGHDAQNAKWLSNDSWYSKDRNFIIYSTEEEIAKGRHQFGEPDGGFKVNGRQIDTYEKPIKVNN